MRPQSCMVTYLSMRTAPVTRSISTPQKSKMKPWQSEELISSFSVGRRQFRRRPEHGLAQRLDFVVGHQARRPVAGGGQPRKCDCVVGIAARSRPAARELDLVGADIELRGRQFSELRLDLHRGEMRRAADRGREAAGIIAGGDRPGIARGIELGDDADVGRFQAERIGDDLRQHGAVALPCGTEATCTETEPSGSSATVAVACAPFFGPALRRSSGVSTVVM